MDEEQLQHVREKLAEAELREHEERQILRRDVLTIAERDQAISAATQAALIGTLPSIIWVFIRALSAGWLGAFQLFFGLLCFFIPFLFAAAAAGVVSGLFAHWWFAHSTVNVPRAAIAIAFLADALLFGWAMVLS